MSSRSSSDVSASHRADPTGGSRNVDGDDRTSIAAICTIWFDDVTRSAYYEPVATVPSHQRRGLGKSIMTEGLRRLQRMQKRRSRGNPDAKAA